VILRGRSGNVIIPSSRGRLGAVAHRTLAAVADNQAETINRRGFNMKYPKLMIAAGAAILLGTASLFPALAPTAGANSDDAVVKTAGSVTYISGGVGTDSIDHLNSLAGNFNLKLVFALNSGSYLSAVGVVIADAAGNTLLNTTSDGPWLLAKLPTGNYQIVATVSGNAVKRQVAVGAAKLRTVDFRWASE
jgi:hypothetical protein